MSTQYETQGYTINNAGRRLVVDPITRIEGHMRCEVNINDQNVITNAVSCGTMFRGLEIILQGRDPRDPKGQIGAYEAALMNTKMAIPEQPLEILRTLHSFDPCLACSTHVLGDDGSELISVQVR